MVSFWQLPRIIMATNYVWSERLSFFAHHDFITNELDCPLLTMADNIFILESFAIGNAVSIIHECSNSCKFVSKQWPRNIEREQCLTSQIEFQHDYSNSMYFFKWVLCKSVKITFTLIWPHVYSNLCNQKY